MEQTMHGEVGSLRCPEVPDCTELYNRESISFLHLCG